MYEIVNLIDGIGELTVLITPLTLVIGIINAIKKPKGDSKPYTIMAIVSAYLIIVPLFFN
ncbi:hypothetical protein [Clostridium sp.]|uniref:hypothetical protein n=1 Tax=Clostridium sp. TaxID=1506 RepID=UPI0029152110|nr:hypothetical protein [Clostridium sp.]MDU5108620.1 hypothetical protein [Clostridium sp.]